MGGGYGAATISGLSLAPGMTATADLALDPLPLGVLAGRVRDGTADRPLAASLAVAGTPVTAMAMADGRFLLPLPAGTYTLTIEMEGYETAAAGLVMAAGRTTLRDIELASRPPVLVVDDDYVGDWLWHDREQWHVGALDALDVQHDVWPVKEWGSPAAEDLAPYGTVLWLTGDARYDTLTAREQEALRAYLEGGGALLLSGQHVARDIAGDPGSSLRLTLGTEYLGTGPTPGAITGGGPLEGLTLTLGEGDGADNAYAPSALGAAEGAVVAARYGDGGVAAVAFDADGYQALLLGFGVEGVASAAERQALLRAALSWLGAPVTPEGFTLRVEGPAGPVAPGDAVPYVLTVGNATAVTRTGIVITDVVPAELTVGSAAPPATLSDGVLRWEGLALPPGETLQASFTGRLQDGTAPGGSVLNAAYGAASDQGAARPLSGIVRMSVAPTYDASLSLPVALAYGWSGETAIVRLTLANRGLMTDTYGLTMEGGPWPVALPVTQATLSAGDCVDVTLSIAVPEGVTEGETGIYTVRARSMGDVGVEGQAVVAVKAGIVRGRIWFPVLSR
jgi:uncharacterized repeat protein (TIGR01451 family)